MRIACANWTRRHAGGVESYLSFLMPRLRDAGHDVRLWTECDLPADRPLIGGVEAEWCVGSVGRDEAFGGLRNWNPAVVLVHGLVDPAIEAELLAIGPAVFVAHSYYGTCISGGKTLTFPAPVPCSRTFGPACLAMFYPRRCGGLSPVTMAREYAKQARRLSLLRAYGHVLTLSRHMRAEYLRHGFDPESVTALPPYVPSAGVHRPAAAAPDRARALRLLYLGRIDRLKGCRVLIEALPLVRARLDRPVHLELAGEGPDRDHCAELAESLRDPHVTIRQAGWLDVEARAAALLAADVVVVPSLWPEPYGLAGLEAVTAGIPVAAFATGGVPEWLDEGVTGALAPADPPTAPGLAAAICRSTVLERRVPPGAAAIDAMAATHVGSLVGVLERSAMGRTVVSHP